MLERISKHWPIFTAVALAIVSLFNVGYFIPIGIHFIGIVDVTNIIYSFGLAFGFISVLGPLIAQVIAKPFNLIDELKKNDGAGAKVFAALLVLSALFGMVGGHYFGVMLPYFVVWAAFFTTFMIATEYHIFASTGSVDIGRIVLVSWGMMIFLILFGAWVCTLQMNNAQTFEVATKDRIIANAKILRSSSSGFLIYADERVAYIPSGEIKSVTASTRPWL